MLPAVSAAEHLENDLHTEKREEYFTVLILGDSQMAGAGWEGGFQKCIEEAYPHAVVINLAQNGSRLMKDDIQEQWEYFLTELSEEFALPDYVLMDGGANDLLSMNKHKIGKEEIKLIQDELYLLLEKIHDDSSDTQIIYMTMPPLQEWSDSDKGPPSYETQKAFWKEIRSIANRYYYVTVLDLFVNNPFHYPCTECYSEHFDDALHLNETGYRKVFNYYLDNILVARWAE